MRTSTSKKCILDVVIWPEMFNTPCIWGERWNRGYVPSAASHIYQNHFFLLCLLPAILKTLLPSAYWSDTLTPIEQGSSSCRNFVSTAWNFFLCMKDNYEIQYNQCKRCSSETIRGLTASHSFYCCCEALNNITKAGVSKHCEKFVRRQRCSL